jgi:hypothetical protein
MDFIGMYNLWVSAQAKAASVPGLSVSINQVESVVECKAAGQVFYTSTDLIEVHIALDSAIAVNGILNP